MPPRTRKAAEPAPTPTVDPLADLREPEEGRYPAGDTTEETTEETPGPILVSQDAWDDARVAVVAQWHADTVSLGFLHKGGNCGCRYLAGVALTGAMPVQAIEPQED